MKRPLTRRNPAEAGLASSLQASQPSAILQDLRWFPDPEWARIVVVANELAAMIPGDRFHNPEWAEAAVVAAELDAMMQAVARQRDYHVEYVGRKAAGARRGLTLTEARGHGRGVRGAANALRTEAGVQSATPAQIDVRTDGLEALARVRDGVPVRDAEKQLELPRGYLKQNFPTGFDARGRIKPGDREVALMVIVGVDGDQLVIVRGSRNRSLVGRHRIAVLGVLSGELPESALKPFVGKSVSGVPLLTDIGRLRVLFDLDMIKPGSPYPVGAVR